LSDEGVQVLRGWSPERSVRVWNHDRDVQHEGTSAGATKPGARCRVIIIIIVFFFILIHQTNGSREIKKKQQQTNKKTTLFVQ